ncbi:MAG: hypothetical protein ABI207_08660 [Crocinitomicaceae bacterium]
MNLFGLQLKTHFICEMIPLPLEFEQRIIDQYSDGKMLLETLVSLNGPVSVRIHPLKKNELITKNRVPWSSSGYYLDKRPVFTLDPFFHAGGYYPQEAGSMLIEVALKEMDLPENPIGLDMCASPGGKSTLITDFLNRKGLLVANEIIRSRALVLRENLSKWGYENCMVSNNAPEKIGQLTNTFDFVLIDAPCSGEGMFRKDENARSEWSSANAKMCVGRQRNILENAIECLKEDGYLIYSTCTFNPEENEHNIQWLIDEMDMEYCSLPIEKSWNLYSPKNNLGYSCLPNHTESEGFYIALLRKKTKTNSSNRENKLKSLEKAALIPEVISSLFSEDIKVYFHQGFYYAFPKEHVDLGKFLLKELNVMKWGVRVGEMINNKFIPDHELALSFLLSENSFPKVNLEKQEALNYLKGNSFSVNAPIGWCIITYENVPLGWIKNLGNRTNNYYPKEYRIRMDISNA